MGNQRSRETLMCQAQDRSRVQNKFKKLTKAQKTRVEKSKGKLRQILSIDSHNHLVQIKDFSPFDQAIQFLEEFLIGTTCDWGEPLLYNFIEKIKHQTYKKYQTYKWNIEVNMQKEAIKNKAIRKCLSDSTKADIFNLSSSTQHHEIDKNQLTQYFADSPVEECDCEDDMELVQSTDPRDSHQIEIQNTHKENMIFSPLSDQTNSIDQTYFNQSPRYSSNNGELTFQARSKKDFEVKLRRQFSEDVARSQRVREDKIKDFLKNTQDNDLFKRKLKIIQKHMKNRNHPLKVLIELFGDQLSIVKLNMNTMITSEFHSEYNKSGIKNTFKVSDRLIEDTVMKQQRFNKILESVKTFILLLKLTLVKFYQIDYNSLRQGQKNYLDDQVKEMVLGYQISKVIMNAASEAFREDLIELQNAMNIMSNVDLSFWEVCDQYHLNHKFYLERKQIKQGGQPQILLENMDDKAFEFQIVKRDANKSYNFPEFGQYNTQTRPSEKQMLQRKLIDSLKEYPNQKQSKIDIDDQEPEKTIISGESCSKARSFPYQKCISLMKELEKVVSLKKKKVLIKYIWSKMQKEVYEYWKDYPGIVPLEKQMIFEDTRLMLMSYILVKSQCTDIIITFKALNPFISMHQQCDSMPMATVESAISAIIQDSNFEEPEITEEFKNPGNNYIDLMSDKINRHNLFAPKNPSVASWMSRKSVITNAQQRQEFMQKIKILKEKVAPKEQLDIQHEEQDLQKRLRANEDEKKQTHLSNLKSMYQNGNLNRFGSMQKSSFDFKNTFQSIFRNSNYMRRAGSKENLRHPLHKESGRALIDTMDRNQLGPGQLQWGSPQMMSSLQPTNELQLSRAEGGSNYSKEFPNVKVISTKFDVSKTPVMDPKKRNRKYTDLKNYKEYDQ
eukprot:403373947